MRRVLLIVVAAGVVSAGCSSGPDERQQSAEPRPDSPGPFETARAEAEDWLQLESFELEGGTALAVRSFPDGPDHLVDRTFLYDQALALLWFSWTGDDQTARRLARTLVDRQLEDGSWGFSFETGADGFYDDGYIRTGAVAWAGWALAYHADRTGDEEAREAARSARSFLETTRIERDDSRVHLLYGAGRGYHDPKTGERTLGEPVDFVATEHQLDAHMMLEALDGEAGDELRHRILEVLWVPDQNRFAMGASHDDVDYRRALDAAGGWGALWLLSVDRSDLARASLDYTLDEFPAHSADLDGGFTPYLDPADGLDPDDELIFVEGSLGVALAALRLDDEPTTRQILEMAVQLADRSGPGIPYANLSAGHFEAVPAAASTIWFLMVAREYATGQSAPVFVPADTD